MGFVKNAVSLLAFSVVFGQVGMFSQTPSDSVRVAKASIQHSSALQSTSALMIHKPVDGGPQGQANFGILLNSLQAIPEAPSIILLGTALMSFSVYGRRRAQRIGFVPEDQNASK